MQDWKFAIENISCATTKVLLWSCGGSGYGTVAIIYNMRVTVSPNSMIYRKESGKIEMKFEALCLLISEIEKSKRRTSGSDTGGSRRIRESDAKKSSPNYSDNHWQIVLQAEGKKKKKESERKRRQDAGQPPSPKLTCWFPGRHLELNRYQDSQWWVPENDEGLTLVSDLRSSITNLYNGGTNSDCHLRTCGLQARSKLVTKYKEKKKSDWPQKGGTPKTQTKEYVHWSEMGMKGLVTWFCNSPVGGLGRKKAELECLWQTAWWHEFWWRW